MTAVSSLVNRLAVQLFKRVPGLAGVWARRHRFVEVQGVPWTPVRAPLARSTIALVTTAGVHLRSQEPFDMHDPEGDPSYRMIPLTASQAELTITHRYYDHSAADRDVNVVLPLDRLRELHVEGRIGGLAPFAYGFMGHIDGRHLRTLVEHSAPAVARHLRSDGVDAVVLTPA